jgi:GNAT superfamily N-acetyltransferase
MWAEMGRGEGATLDLMETAATEYFTKAVPDGSYRGFLAVNSGVIVGGGGIAVSAWPGVVGQREPRRAMILNLYVEREHRRRGVASALMAAMIAWCRANGFSSVALHASEDGRPLYEKLGFKPTDEMRLDLRTAAT